MKTTLSFHHRETVESLEIEKISCFMVQYRLKVESNFARSFHIIAAFPKGQVFNCLKFGQDYLSC